MRPRVFRDCSTAFKSGLHMVVIITEHACDHVLKPRLHIVVMIVSTVLNMFLTLFQAVLIHVNTLITTSQA